VEAQTVVADSDGRDSVNLWVALDFCLRLGRWTVHLHFVLNNRQALAPQGFLPWLDPY